MRITILGSGTSTGVPVPGCHCSVCTSTDPRNQRLRTSVFIQLDPDAEPGSGNGGSLLVDTSPDLRWQVLRAQVKRIDAVFYTHAHADHIFGIDDLRSFNYRQQSAIPVYAGRECARELERVFRYVFRPDPFYQGASPPRLHISRLEPYRPIQFFGHKLIPLPVLHGKMEVYGFRLGNIAYVTDCSTIPDRTREHLLGLDVLILNALRERPHPTHLSVSDAVSEAAKVRPKRTRFIHISHECEHTATNESIRQLTDLDVELAYDGLMINS